MSAVVSKSMFVKGPISPCVASKVCTADVNEIRACSVKDGKSCTASSRGGTGAGVTADGETVRRDMVVVYRAVLAGLLILTNDDAFKSRRETALEQSVLGANATEDLCEAMGVVFWLARRSSTNKAFSANETVGHP